MLHLPLFWFAIGIVLASTVVVGLPDHKAEHIERCDLAWQFATTSADTLVLDSIFECDPPKDTIIAWWRDHNLAQQDRDRRRREDILNGR